MRTLPLVAVVLACAACGAPPPATPITVANHIQVVVTGAPDTDALPFDPRAARLLEATAQLYALAGHAITFQFDAALVPEWRSTFNELLTADVEATIADLVRLRESWPRVFAREVGAFERIVFRYDPAAREQTAALDPAARAVRVTNAGGPWRLGRGAIAEALRDAYEQDVVARLGGLEPDAVAAADRADYLEALTDSRLRGLWRKAHPGAESREAGVDTTLVPKLVRLAELARGDASLAAKVRAELFGELSSFSRAYFEGPPRTATWQRAERAYVGWLAAELPSASDDEKLRIAGAIWVRAQGKSLPVFPGFDRFAFGMAILDEWARAGHPKDASAPHGQLFGAVVCPSTRSNEGGGRSFAGRCEHAFYQDVFGDEAGTKRFAQALLARSDPALVEAAAVEAYYAPNARDKLEVALGFARALEGNEALWTVALDTSADEAFEEAAEVHAPRVVDEARRIWRAFPSSASRHGTLLYAMVQTDRYEHGNVDWARFADAFGAPVSAEEFAAYLDHGVRAISLARVMWPALGKFARAPLLERRLDAFMDDSRARAYDSADPLGAVGGISTRLCDEHATADLTELAAYFKRRLAGHPGEIAGDKLDDPASCTPAAVHTKRVKHHTSTSSGAAHEGAAAPLPPGTR